MRPVLIGFRKSIHSTFDCQEFIDQDTEKKSQTPKAQNFPTSIQPLIPLLIIQCKVYCSLLSGELDLISNFTDLLSQLTG